MTMQSSSCSSCFLRSSGGGVGMMMCFLLGYYCFILSQPVSGHLTNQTSTMFPRVLEYDSTEGVPQKGRQLGRGGSSGERGLKSPPNNKLQKGMDDIAKIEAKLADIEKTMNTLLQAKLANLEKELNAVFGGGFAVATDDPDALRRFSYAAAELKRDELEEYLLYQQQKGFFPQNASIDDLKNLSKTIISFFEEEAKLNEDLLEERMKLVEIIEALLANLRLKIAQLVGDLASQLPFEEEEYRHALGELLDQLDPGEDAIQEMKNKGLVPAYANIEDLMELLSLIKDEAKLEEDLLEQRVKLRHNIDARIKALTLEINQLAREELGLTTDDVQNLKDFLNEAGTPELSKRDFEAVLREMFPDGPSIKELKKLVSLLEEKAELPTSAPSSQPSSVPSSVPSLVPSSVPSWSQLCFTEETTVRMADGSLKAIADIEIGDDVAKGGLVTSVVTFAQGESAPGLCRIDDKFAVTRMHMVLDQEAGVFVPAKSLLVESEELCNEHANFVYDIETKNHVIEFENGIVATDFSEHDIIPEFFEIEKEMALAKVKSLHQDKLLNQDSLFLYEDYFAGESLVKMQDGSFKAIEDIELNDVVSLGGKVVGFYKFDGSQKDRMCRLAPNVVVSDEYFVYSSDGAGAGAFVEADYGSTCQETPVKTLYHLDTEAHLIELKDNVFTLDYQEHDDLDEFFEKEVEMTKNLIDIVAKGI